MGSDWCFGELSGSTGISIHAPRVGSDKRHRTSIAKRCHFNPRSPCGERRGVQFISLHSVRISIHAPRVGSDARQRPPGLGEQNFNPRSPCGERRKTGLWVKKAFEISIHAPRVGSDEVMPDHVHLLIISIHAPRVGSDQWDGDFAELLRKFQSTLPVWGATVRRKTE